MCGVYRLSERHHTPVHTPARCRRCWRGCKDAPVPGQVYCAACLTAAATCPDPVVVSWAADLADPPASSVLADLVEAP